MDWQIYSLGNNNRIYREGDIVILVSTDPAHHEPLAGLLEKARIQGSNLNPVHDDNVDRQLQEVLRTVEHLRAVQ
jgi:hypothetical protein